MTRLPVRPIIQYWDAEVVPGDIAPLIGSFRDLNPDLEHLVFSESTAEALIAEHFSAREVGAFRACAVPAMQADYFRCCAVLVHGGIYADADFRCLTSLRPLLDESEAGELFQRPTVHMMNGRPTQRVLNGFFWFRTPGHPFLRLALEIATACVETRLAERVWPNGDNVREAIALTVGPGVFTGLHLMHEWGSFDALIEATAGGSAEAFARLFCEVVGGHDRVVEAFEGVRVSSFERMMEWIGHPEAPLGYKQSDAYWMNVRTPIFR